MNAVNWVRSRQESAELSYWSSFVFFNPKDRSFNNRIYLVYLLAFFSIWWFIVMIWFSEAGAFLLRTISPINPISPAVALELSALLIWFLVSFFQSLRRSPVKFSEEDSLPDLSDACKFEGACAAMDGHALDKKAGPIFAFGRGPWVFNCE